MSDKVKDILHQIREFQEGFQEGFQVNPDQARSFAEALAREPCVIKGRPLPPSRGINVTPIDMVYNAFQLTGETYYSIFTWPRWLQQCEIIRFYNPRLLLNSQIIRLNDWMVEGPRDKHPFLVRSENFDFQFSEPRAICSTKLTIDQYARLRNSE